jgi:hypothetical protein
VLGEIRDNLNQCRALGSERFKDEIEAAWAERYVPARPGDRGRRSKNARLISWKWQSGPISYRDMSEAVALTGASQVEGEVRRGLVGKPSGF